MKKVQRFAVMLGAAYLAACHSSILTTDARLTRPQTPIAKKIPHNVSVHGEHRIDDYYWLRDDTRSDEAVLGYLAAENSYAEAMLRPVQSLQEQLYTEIVNLLPSAPLTLPVEKNGYRYRKRYEKGADYPVHTRQKILAIDAESAAEETILREALLAAGHDYFALGGYSITLNNQYMAYTVDNLGRELYTVRFRDLETGLDLPETLVGTVSQVVWANDNQTIFYIKRNPETLLGDQVYRHTLGTYQDDDVLVYEEQDKRLHTWLYKSADDSLIYIYHQGVTLGGASILPADKPMGSFEPFIPLEEGHRYEFYKSGSDYFIRTNWGAGNFRLMKVDLATRTNRSTWQEIVPGRPDVILETVLVLDRHIVLQERTNAQVQFRVIDRHNGKEKLLEFDEDAYAVYIGADTETAAITELNLEPSSQQLLVSYESLTTPVSLYEFDLATGQRNLIEKTTVRGSFDAASYTSERLFLPARDNTAIPVSLVYKKQLFHKDGSNPMYLYAYGAYGLNQEANFWPAIMPMLDRGFVFAIAHVRGGGMMGPDWYQAGRRRNKKNTINDFIDVTEELVRRGYAHSRKVFASGASAGATLMGAVATQRPDLYRGVILGVPFLDVVTTMLDESIPLVTNEYEEWGDPRLRSDYEYMLSYSPYDQIARRRYTNMYVYAGLHDARVQYYEPAKFVAKMRAHKTDDKQLLLLTDMSSGHAGVGGRYQAQWAYAREFAFILGTLDNATAAD